MTDKPVPTHEQAETVLDKVKPLLEQLPKNTESREAARIFGVLGELVHDSIEKAPRPPCP